MRGRPRVYICGGSVWGRAGNTNRSRSPLRFRGSEFIWQQVENERHLRNFVERSGPQKRYNHTATAQTFFEEFFTGEIWQLLMEMTNLNATKKRSEEPQKHKGNWKNVTLEEMKVFISLVISMEIIKLPQISMYWQKKHWFFDIPSFNKVMPRDRFIMIWHYLHFCDEYNAPDDNDPSRDKLY